MYIGKAKAIYGCCAVVVISAIGALCTQGTDAWLPFTIVQFSFLMIQFIIGYFHSKEIWKDIDKMKKINEELNAQS